MSQDAAGSAAAAPLQQALLAWFSTSGRHLPWRETDDAYAILVSEIMLQQTQVSRVVPIYEQFLCSFPDVASLAAAPRSAVVTAWRGLGYNRRAVGLHRAAGTIVERHGGLVPRDLPSLLALPGVGHYTARAIRAFAYGLDDAPVDTNIARVLTRAVAGAPVRGRALQQLADASVAPANGRVWSAALMDLGATCCVAAAPRCGRCPVAEQCAWRQRGGDDPAAASRRPPAPPFAGSTRQRRGRLVDALRDTPLRRTGLAAVVGEPEEQAMRLADAIVADGLAQWDGETLRLSS